MDKAARKAILRELREQERARWWATLGLTSAQLDALHEHILANLIDCCSGELELSEQWANQVGVDWSRLEQALMELGGYCDCEVEANVCPD
ncbi:Protein of unknown function [Actinokineospora alba]|uniref:DUF2695 domain-containing protein n=1 Tax=Actinokineospora alba TaxID=504798 RepID=A0A1H0KCB2_9PSEU|nr:DUF2695 domain-containing protein [Actinokineospora alba]TDP67960.1 uncharacterized protein DUF2695 [Actinokineospora alba]SDH89685.1 Protein of unknown function [Actinokineospora alba]SDO53493.1 Protein of unknown function [Actinokineospora alba]